LVVSIAAGLSLDFFTHRLPDSVPLVRVMPNTPSLVLEGLSAVSRGSNAGDEHVARVRALFEAVGRVVEVEERHMDAVTAISGSGPAYVLLVIEAMIDAGVFAGLARPLARELAIQTVLGTARMTRETGRHPAELRDMITSPGGTTIHAMRVLEDEAVRAAIMNAVEAAVERAGELGQG
jgi:pyrroline-5-carboxylate reductase